MLPFSVDAILALSNYFFKIWRHYMYQTGSYIVSSDAISSRLQISKYFWLLLLVYLTLPHCKCVFTNHMTLSEIAKRDCAIRHDKYMKTSWHGDDFPCPSVDTSQKIPSWWRHQMETFSAQLAICARNSPVPGEFPAQRPVTRSFHVFFDLRPNKRLNKQPWGWWFETPSWSLWRQCNVKAELRCFPCF